MLSQDFIFDGCTILVHGFSRVVLEILRTAAQNRKLFRVLCTGGLSRYSCLWFLFAYLLRSNPVFLLPVGHIFNV